MSTKNVILEILSPKSGRVLYEQKNQQKNMEQLMKQILEESDKWNGI